MIFDVYMSTTWCYIYVYMYGCIYYLQSTYVFFPLFSSHWSMFGGKTAAGKGPWTSQRIGSPWWTSATTGRSGWKVPMVDALLWWFGKPSRGVTWRHLWLLGEHHGMLLVHVFCFREKIKFESNMSEVENKNIELAWRHDDMKHEGAIVRLSWYRYVMLHESLQDTLAIKFEVAEERRKGFEWLTRDSSFTMIWILKISNVFLDSLFHGECCIRGEMNTLVISSYRRTCAWGFCEKDAQTFNSLIQSICQDAVLNPTVTLAKYGNIVRYHKWYHICW